MFKNINQSAWAFDVEWILDSNTLRRLYQFPNEMEDSDVFKVMWEVGRARKEEKMLLRKLLEKEDGSTVKEHLLDFLEE